MRERERGSCNRVEPRSGLGGRCSSSAGILDSDSLQRAASSAIMLAVKSLDNEKHWFYVSLCITRACVCVPLGGNKELTR